MFNKLCWNERFISFKMKKFICTTTLYVQLGTTKAIFRIQRFLKNILIFRY